MFAISLYALVQIHLCNLNRILSPVFVEPTSHEHESDNQNTILTEYRSVPSFVLYDSRFCHPRGSAQLRPLINIDSFC